jgi:uncharacterized RDD family membrane protein YckC
MSVPRKTLTIQTPEGIAFSLTLADPITRFMALAMDLLCVYGLSAVAAMAASALGLLSLDLAAAVSLIASFVLSVGYPIALEWYWKGQTVGKRVLRLQVMDEQGLRLQFHQIVIRNVVRILDALPLFYLVGGLASLISPRGQRVGDLAAGTIVVAHPRIAEPDLEQLLPGKYNSCLDHPHLAARLRHCVTPAQAGVIVQALLRRDALDPEARLALFAALRQRLTAIVRFPPEATDGISDEQYVRNVAEILFRPTRPQRP